MTSSPFLSVDYLLTKSDLIIDEKYNKNELENSFEKIFSKYSSDNAPIIFLTTHLLSDYIEIILKITKPFILITASNMDHSVPYLYYPPRDNNLELKCNLLLEKSELIIWITKNACIKHDKLLAFPLGPKWQFKSTNFFGEDKTKHLNIFHQHCLTPEKKFYNKNLKKNLYFNFSSSTTDNPFFKSHKNIRKTIRYILEKKNNLQYNQNLEFHQYIEELANYKFCISPPGAGIDTHRTWEALMVGTIPIVMTSPLDYLYKNLPVLIIDDWSKINYNFLNDIYSKMILKSYDFSILYTDYWDKYIQEKKIIKTH